MSSTTKDPLRILDMAVSVLDAVLMEAGLVWEVIERQMQEAHIERLGSLRLCVVLSWSFWQRIAPRQLDEWLRGDPSRVR